jgi:hypothetical protein
MKRGPKPDLPSQKLARGTFRPSIDAGKVEVIEPNAMPVQPDWLTAEGEEVWMDDLGRVSEGRLVGEKDSTQFANYCNLQGAINKAWRSGECPPVAALTEARRMAEQFGIFGAKSRLQQKGDPGQTKNPFSRNGRR